MKNIISTGIGEIDKYAGIREGDYVIIGGAPGTGVVTLATRILCNIAKGDGAVQYISLKNGSEQVMEDFRNVEGGADVSGLRVFVDPVTSNSLDVNRLSLLIRNRLPANVSVVFIDCLTMIEHPDGMQAVSDTIRELARETGTVIMAASTTQEETSRKLHPDVLIQTQEPYRVGAIGFFVSRDGGKDENVVFNL